MLRYIHLLYGVVVLKMKGYLSPGGDGLPGRRGSVGGSLSACMAGLVVVSIRLLVEESRAVSKATPDR